jgi:hypothetical protein
MGQQGKKRMGVGTRIGLRWIPEGQGVRYLGIQISFQLPIEANFEKLMFAIKGKMIAWGKCNLSLTSKILVANQVFFSSMWYLAAYWNPNPKMCNQIRRVVRNFIWGERPATHGPRSNGIFLHSPCLATA